MGIGPLHCSPGLALDQPDLYTLPCLPLPTHQELRLQSDVSFKIVPCSPGAARFWQEVEDLYAVVALSMPTMYGAQASDLLTLLMSLKTDRDPETEKPYADVARLAVVELGLNDVLIQKESQC